MPSYQQFQPTLDQQTVQNYLQLYKEKPTQFKEDEVEIIKQHADFYKMPFAEDEKVNNNRIGGLISQMGAGFVSGFTTFNVGDAPRDEWESIARNVGHLAGFVGYVPKAPFRMLNIKRLSDAANFVRGRSIPMVVAKAAEKKVSKIAGSVIKGSTTARADAAGTAMNFLTKPKTKDLLKGAFHLGVASSVSSWQGGVDEMMRGFIGGAQTGAVFRTIGNIVQTGSLGADKVLRGIASSAYQGLHSTMQGATTPEQVYEYLLGAYFGVKEMPYHRRQGLQHLGKMREKGEIEPEIIKGWDKLDETTQKWTSAEVKKIYKGDPGELKALAYWIAKTKGVDVEEANRLAEESIKNLPKYTESGEEISTLPQEAREQEALLNERRGQLETEGREAPTETDVQTGAIPEDVTFTKRTENWVRRQLGKTLDEDPNPDRKVIEVSYDIDSTFDSLLNISRKVGTDTGKTPINPSAILVKHIEKQHGITLDAEGRNFWRQHGERRLKEQDVTQWSISQGNLKVLTGKRNDAGVQKILKEEPKLVDEIYGEALKERYPTSDRIEAEWEKSEKTLMGNDAFWKMAGNKEARIASKIKYAEPSGRDIEFDPKTETFHAGRYETTEFQATGNEKKFPNNAKHNIKEPWQDKPGLFRQDLLDKGITSTHDAIMYGERTGTSRNNRQEVKVGEIIDVGQTGTPVYAKVTKVYNKTLGKLIKSGEMTPEQWSKREGWDSSYLTLNPKVLNKFPIDFKIVQDSKVQFVRGKPDKHAYAVLDNYVEYDKKSGGMREFDFLELEDFYYRTAKSDLESGMKPFTNKKLDSGEYENEFGTINSVKVARRLAREKLENMHTDVLVEADKGGYYYYGGKGDAKRQYYLKYHPQLGESDIALHNQINHITNAIAKSQGRSKIKVSDRLQEDMLEFVDANSTLTPQESTRLYMKSYISNIIYDMEMNGGKYDPLFKNLPKQLKKGFISSAKAFNKRQQIWFTSGISSDPKFIKNWKGKDGKGIKDLVIDPMDGKDGKWNVVYTIPNKKDNILWEDGAVYGRNDVISAQNEGWGMADTGSNKSFIVNGGRGVGEKGAMLGKYMIHSTSKELNDYMHKNNIHYIIPLESAKQIGNRGNNVYNLTLGRDGKIKLKEAVSPYGKIKKRYKLNNLDMDFIPMESFRGVFSERTDASFLEPKKLPKQMSTNLTPFGFKDIATGTIDDMYNTLSRKAFLGEEEWNEKLEDYLKDPVGRKSDLRDLTNNLDSISVEALLRGMKQPNAKTFSNAVYAKILKFNREIVEDMMSDGEINESEYKKELSNNSDMLRIHERIVSNSPESLAGILHPFARDYRMTSMRNYIINRLVRPKLDNSIVTRLRPYDIGLQSRQNRDGRTSDLKKALGRDRFYLDDGFRDKEIRSASWGSKPRKLGEVWDEYLKAKEENNRSKSKKLEKILEAVAVRVPMDSLSGARVLKFGGFTGIRGYGSLIHPKALEALGGADLDGDKAYFFFGSEKHGMKKKWKKMYKDQEKEFGDESTNDVKAAFREELTDTPISKDLTIAERKKLNSDESMLQWSPVQRRDFSSMAADGRNRLGPSVLNNAAILGAYAAIEGSRKKYYEWEDTIIEWKDGLKTETPVHIRMIPKKGKENMNRFRRIMRASVAFTSDPMDEAGLKSSDIFLEKVLDSAFNWEVRNSNTRRYHKAFSTQFNKTSRHLGKKKYGGLQRHFSNVNSGLWGRNWADGRRWSYGEIKAKLEGTFEEGGMPAESRNTLLSKIPQELEGIDWSDSIFNRVDKNKLFELYSNHSQNVTMFDRLKALLGRRTMAIPRGAYIDLVYNLQLHTADGMRAQTDPTFTFEGARPWKPSREIFKHEEKDFSSYHGYEKYPEENTPQGLYKRKRDLHSILRKAEDFVMNDISDMAAMDHLLMVGDNMLESPLLKTVVEFAESLRKKSYLMARKRRFVGKDHLTLEEDAERRLRDEVEREVSEKEPLSSLADQEAIDSEIRAWKKKEGRTDQERDLLDALLLGSVHKGRHQEAQRLRDILALDKYKYEWTKNDRDRLFQKSILEGMLETVEKKIDNTSLSRLGFASKAVSDKNVKDYMDFFTEYFEKAVETPTIREQEVVSREAELSDKPQYILDKEGNIVKGSIIESSDYDVATKKYLDEFAPFVGLEKGTLKGSTKELYLELKDHLDFYGRITGRDLNGLVRGLLGKDLNAMNLEDFNVLNRWFNQVREGTWWQRMRDKILSKTPQDFPAIYKSMYHMFPDAVNRMLMRYPDGMDLVSADRPFNDKWGNTITGRVKLATSVMGDVQAHAHSGYEMSNRVYEDEIKKLNEEMDVYVKGLDDGYALYEIAANKRQESLVYTRDPATGKIIHDETKLSYVNESRKSQDTHNWGVLKDKKYTINLGGAKGNVIRTGEEVVGDIGNILTKWNGKMKEWLKGDNGVTLKKYTDIARESGRFTYPGLKKMRKKLMDDIQDSVAKGEVFAKGLGVDGMRELTRLVAVSFSDERLGNESLIKMLKNVEVEPTKFFELEKYFPHILLNRKKGSEQMVKALDKIMNDSTLSKTERSRKVKELIIHHKQLTGDYIPGEDMLDGTWNAISEALKDISKGRTDAERKGAYTWFSTNRKAHSQYSRTANLEGWDATPEAYNSYMKNIFSTYYGLVGQMGARVSIMRFRGKNYKNNPDLTNNWADFLNLYAQQAMGYPSKIPQHVMDNPNMKIKGTPYSFFSDSTVLKRINSVGRKLGLKRFKRDIPEELQGFDFSDLNKWGAMEAKYELAALLAHPKSMIANMYGGTVHTIISTGYDNFKNARNFDYLKRHVNKDWNSKTDVEEAVRRHGVIEEFMQYEADISPEIRGKKWGGFIEEAFRKIKKDPNLEDSSLRSIASKHGITESIFNKAAWFMRKPERALRRDAFMAHYLHARDNFKGAFKQWDHPYLIEMAKKGVKATQFLYSAPFRPMFAATALGKVWTRFQLWSWNSVRFRNQVIREAAVRGWKEGTPEFKRFQRLATADLFMLGMANIFMYSLFENALPAPWNWFQDTSDMLFGDDKDRERAFFGAYPAPLQPLQLVTPPALRLLPSIFKGMVTDDYSKLSDYYLWSMAPFGRLGRDILGKGGVIENPMRGIEKLTGIPYAQLSSAVKKRQDETMLRPGRQ